MPAKIHPTAIVAAEAVLEDGVEVGPFCRIEGKVFIGEGTVLQSNNFVDKYTRVGKGNIFGHGTVIGTPPQDLKWNDSQESWLEIGDNNIFREYCTINRATGEGTKTVVGSKNFFMANCHIAHNCRVGNEIVMANLATLAGHCQVDDWVVIGGVTAMAQHTRIGKGAFLGGTSGLRMDLLPFFRGAGNPACPVNVNVVGMQRRGYSHEHIQSLRAIFKILFVNHISLDDAIKRVEERYPDLPEAKLIVDFIAGTKNGIARPRSQR